MSNNNDAVQHGIDDNPNDDAKKGLELGALGGGTVGAIAGAALGPVGAIVGALIGGSVGSVASGAAVQAVDAVDNDNTVSGLGDGATMKDPGYSSGSGGYSGSSNTPDVHAGATGTGTSNTPDVHAGATGTSNTPDVNLAATASGDYESGSYVGGTDVSNTSGTDTGIDVGGHNIVTGEPAATNAGSTGLGAGAIGGGVLGAAVGGPVGAVVGGALGSLAGGVAGDATETATETTPGRTNMNNLDLTNDTPGIQTGTTPDVHATGTNDRYSQLTSGDYATRPYGTYEGRSISRTDYNSLPETDRTRVQLVEEELHVDKELRQIGEVEISKRVVSEQVQVPVTLEREEVVIHHRAVSGGDASGATIGDQTIVVPISEEFANVTKTAHVTGEVEVEKRVTTEQKTISDTVRHEELDVNEGTTGRVRIENDTTPRV